MIIYYGELRVKLGKRAEYIEALRKSNLEQLFREQHGNLFYSIATSITNENIVVVSDAWETKADFDAHVSSDICKVWFQLHDEFVEKDVRGDTLFAENA